jgi:hypothetical protein
LPWLLPFAACIVLSAAIPARAGIVVTAQSVSASDGAFDVFLTNTGTSAVDIAAFTFEVNVSSSQIAFTDATTSTTTSPYIFAGNSLFGPDILASISMSGTTLDAGDVTADASNVSVGAGASFGLGHVFFTTTGTLIGDATVSFTGSPLTSLSDAVGTDVPITKFTTGTIIGVAMIPEPSSLILATIGLATLGATWFVRRSRQKVAGKGAVSG